MELRYVPRAEFDRIRSLEGNRYERTAAFADACRLNVLYMVRRVGSGHLGTTFSSLDIVSWLHLEVLREGDRYFSSKGHDAPGLYAVLTALGQLDFELIHQLRGLHEITVIVDRNLVQSDTWVDKVSDIGDLEAKGRAFGWAVASCDGHDLRSLASTLEGLEHEQRPKLVIARTRKGGGVSFMEPESHLPRTDTALYNYHVGAPPPEEYERAVEEVRERLNERLARLDSGRVELVEAEPPEHIPAAAEYRQRLPPPPRHR